MENVFMTDEFVAFSAKMAKIKETRKAKEEEAKKVFAQLKAEIKQFDDTADQETKTWEAFVTKFNVQKKQ